MFANGFCRLALLAVLAAVLTGGVAAAGEAWWPARRTAVTVDAANRNADRIRRSQNARNNRINAVNTAGEPVGGGWCR
jgi:hypothetical protein